MLVPDGAKVRTFFVVPLLLLREEAVLPDTLGHVLSSGDGFLQHGRHERLQPLDVDGRQPGGRSQELESAELYFEGLPAAAAADVVVVVVVTVVAGVVVAAGARVADLTSVAVLRRRGCVR